MYFVSLFTCLVLRRFPFLTLSCSYVDGETVVSGSSAAVDILDTPFSHWDCNSQYVQSALPTDLLILELDAEFREQLGMSYTQSSLLFALGAGG